MSLYIANIQVAAVLFPLLSAALSIPYAIWQYRRFGSISFFKIDYEQGLLIMSSRSIRVNEPNCCAIVEI